MSSQLLGNLLSPVVLSFVLGVIAILIKSDLKIPKALYTGLSIYLLYSIGLKGGAELSVTAFGAFWKPALVTIVLGIITPLIAYSVGRWVGRLGAADAGALAAHYGSVSAVTFMAALSFLDALRTDHEGFMPALVAILEIPAIVVGIGLGRAYGSHRGAGLGSGMREVLSLKSVLLLFGGLLIGWVAGKPGLAKVAPFFVDPFQGLLCFFLLEMGMMAAYRIGDLRRSGLFVIGFALVVPVLHGLLGVVAGHLAGLSLGGATMLGVMAASASYIAAPAAVRVSLPDANPSLYLTAALGVTFPFNIVFGIPLYFAFARWLN